mgnify:CR=1 FL=1
MRPGRIGKKRGGSVFYNILLHAAFFVLQSTAAMAGIVAADLGGPAATGGCGAASPLIGDHLLRFGLQGFLGLFLRNLHMEPG